MKMPRLRHIVIGPAINNVTHRRFCHQIRNPTDIVTIVFAIRIIVITDSTRLENIITVVDTTMQTVCMSQYQLIRASKCFVCFVV